MALGGPPLELADVANGGGESSERRLAAARPCHFARPACSSPASSSSRRDSTRVCVPSRLLLTERRRHHHQEEDAECPLCMEEMDLSDINFKPCPCGYQVRPVGPSMSGPRALPLSRLLTLAPPAYNPFPPPRLPPASRPRSVGSATIISLPTSTSGVRPVGASTPRTVSSSSRSAQRSGWSAFPSPLPPRLPRPLLLPALLPCVCVCELISDVDTLVWFLPLSSAGSNA